MPRAAVITSLGVDSLVWLKGNLEGGGMDHVVFEFRDPGGVGAEAYPRREEVVGLGRVMACGLARGERTRRRRCAVNDMFGVVCGMDDRRGKFG
jgi:hypothetical protein